MALSPETRANLPTTKLRMGRNYLWHRQGDAINAVLAAARLPLVWGVSYQELLAILLLAPRVQLCASSSAN